MACSDPRAVVAVKVFVKQDQVSPVRIGLKFLDTAIDWSAAIFVLKEDPGQPPRNLRRHFPQRHHMARAGGALDLVLLTEVVVILLQRLDYEKVDRKPDGTSPVRVSSKQSGARFGRLVVNAVLLAAHVKHIRII